VQAVAAPVQVLAAKQSSRHLRPVSVLR
jgi:hypothetical protein